MCVVYGTRWETASSNAATVAVAAAAASNATARTIVGAACGRHQRRFASTADDLDFRETAEATAAWIVGPLGRPVLTEAFLEDLRGEDLVARSGMLEDGWRNPSPKQLWNETGVRFGFEPTRYRYEVVSDQQQEQRYKATALTVFSNPGGVLDDDDNDDDDEGSGLFYEALKKHPHVGSHPGYDWIEMVAVGIADTKQRAGQLAALDLMRLWKDATGMDPTHPPESRPTPPTAGVFDGSASASAFDTKHARSRAVLDLLRCTRLRYYHDLQHESNFTYWTADAETYWNGRYYFSDGWKTPPVLRARTKRAAEQHALVALLDQNRDTPLGHAARAYESLLDRYPRLVALRIPPWKDDLAERLKSCLAAADDVWPRDSSGGVRSRRTATAESPATTGSGLRKRERARHPSETRPARIRGERNDLPIGALRSDLRTALESSPVVLVEAGTGSGKSTQIPQYILEDGAPTTRILVTQPRRIAAKSLAKRVSHEWGLAGGGSEDVGYSIRFDSSPPRPGFGTVEFVTTGILLKRLVRDSSSSALEGISHVLIDEVHERDLNTDLLMVLMREHLTSRNGGGPKLLLLSATLDANPLVEYFAPAAAAVAARKATDDRHQDGNTIPVLSLPTVPRHPITTSFLEDLLCGAEQSKIGQGVSPRLRDLASLLLRHNDETLRRELSDRESRGTEADESERIEILEAAVTLQDSYEAQAASSSFDGDLPVPLKPDDLRSVVLDLVSGLAIHLSTIEMTKRDGSKNGGSILCFLPGMDEIKMCMDFLEEDCPPGLRSKLTILPLHSTVPMEEQTRVFRPSKPGHVKVILATNIAESSLTIDDVVSVIDTGLVKDAAFDAVSSTTTLKTGWASKASCIQRSGRAGRVAPGTCYRLYSRADFHAMEEKATPEIQKSCLEATCLQACLLLGDSTREHEDKPSFGSVRELLASALNPPPDDAVVAALDKLAAIRAIEPAGDRGLERLTALGRFLARLPLDPSIGRMLVTATVLGCLGPVLTAAAWFGDARSMVFSHPVPERREETREIQRSFSATSDVEAVVRAYDGFWEQQRVLGWKAARAWAREHHVNPSAIITMRAIRRQLLGYLVDEGLVEPTDVFRGDLRDDTAVDRHGDCRLLVGALWSAAVPRNMASRNRMAGNLNGMATAFDDGDVSVHPSSVLYQRKPPPGTEVPDWVSYRRKIRTSGDYVQGCSSVLPEQILVLGGARLDGTAVASSEAANGGVLQNVGGVLDGWILVDGEKDVVDLLIRARETVESILEARLLRLRSRSRRSSIGGDDDDDDDDDDDERDDAAAVAAADVVVDGIRGVFDDLEAHRIPDPEPRPPSNDDMHDYFLKDDDDDDEA